MEETKIISLEDEIIKNNEEIKNDLEDEKIEDIIKENKDFIEQIAKEEGINLETDKEIEGKINALKEELSDEAVDKILNNMIDFGGISQVDKVKARKELRDLIRTNEAVKKLNDEYEQKLDESLLDINDKMNNLFTNMQIQELSDEIKRYYDLAVENKKYDAIAYYGKLYKEIKSTLTLDLLFEGFNKIKNPSKFIPRVETDFNKEFDKFVLLLKNNKKYKFLNPLKLIDILDTEVFHTNTLNSKLFIYSLCMFINKKGKESVDKYPVFLEGIIRNIYHLPNDSFNDKDILKESIVKYVNLFY